MNYYKSIKALLVPLRSCVGYEDKDHLNEALALLDEWVAEIKNLSDSYKFQSRNTELFEELRVRLYVKQDALREALNMQIKESTNEN